MHPLSIADLSECAFLDHANRKKIVIYPPRFKHTHISAAKAGVLLYPIESGNLVVPIREGPEANLLQNGW